ncbi:hypothetical protein PRIPAC_84441, partial [Pristionchus pacificus]|uniref:Uncharacterized protein n=1 Tax=Pristionchus pacificus TaxID=54126 RepID=A0A2A6BSK6_PRIPA
TIRVFAAVRLIITVIATNLVLLKTDSKPTWSSRSDDALQAKIDQKNIVGILREKITYDDSRRFIEDARFDQAWHLHRSMFLAAINILIMGGSVR